MERQLLEHLQLTEKMAKNLISFEQDVLAVVSQKKRLKATKDQASWEMTQTLKMAHKFMEWLQDNKQAPERGGNVEFIDEDTSPHLIAQGLCQMQHRGDIAKVAMGILV